MKGVCILGLGPELDIFPTALCAPEGRDPYCPLLGTQGLQGLGSSCDAGAWPARAQGTVSVTQVPQEQQLTLNICRVLMLPAQNLCRN